MRKWLAALAFILVSTPLWSAPPVERQRALLYLLKQDCGSCHGMTLQGGLGPALTPDALAGRPPELMVKTILDARADTAMPPWRSELSPAEVEWLVQRLYAGDTNP